jgi:MoxR-like ATPase
MGTHSGKINSKAVQQSQPYQAPVTELVGREEEMKSIQAAWIGGIDNFPFSPLLLGEPGLGKNRIVYECARMHAKELYISQGHEDVSAEDLICTVRFSDDPGKKMDYILSPLATAMIRGGIGFIDEIAKIRPRALAPLVSLLDERRYIDSNLLGERIYAHPGFRFIAATNPSDMEGELLPDFIRSRMRPVIIVGYPPREEIDRMIQKRYRLLSEESTPLLDRFWDLWKEKNRDKPPTPRDSIYLFGYALNLAEFEALGPTAPAAPGNPGFSPILGKKHLDAAFEIFYGERSPSCPKTK